MKTETLWAIHESKYLSDEVTAEGESLTITQVLATRSGMEGGSMIEKLANYFFGCRHARYSFPVTVRRAKRRPQAASLTGTYVACLDCGKEFPYDWQQMKVITSPERHRDQLAELAKHAA